MKPVVILSIIGVVISLLVGIKVSTDEHTVRMNTMVETAADEVEEYVHERIKENPVWADNVEVSATQANGEVTAIVNGVVKVVKVDPRVHVTYELSKDGKTYDVSAWTDGGIGQYNSSGSAYTITQDLVTIRVTD